MKEVTDVTLYSIHKKQDGSGNIYYIPALFLDTLKISSTEKSAENVWAEGGQGNARLISWDYGKTINVSLQDALCTPASLGLCWNGILSANWKDAHLQVKSEACNICNPVKTFSRMEKGFYPRNDGNKGCVSRLLPQLKRDKIDSNLGLLKISSVVDGTKVQGHGFVKNHSYKWRMAIESVVCSVAQVPDRFFDIKGRSYPIDMNRKVSVHSLPTYENYKDAIIYKINSRTKTAPPLAKIIFDYAMEEKGQLTKIEFTLSNQTRPSMTFAEAWQAAGNLIHADGILEERIDNNSSNYYYPLDSLVRKIRYTEKVDDTYNYTIESRMYLILDQDIIDSMTPETVDARSLTSDKITYAENHAMTDLCGREGQIDLDHFGSVEEVVAKRDICEADYLAIIVDNNDNYHALIGIYSEKTQNEPKDLVIWYKPSVPVDVSQFKGLDMWLRFSSINEMIYFLITKYKEDIVSIDPSTIDANEGNDTWAVDDKITTVERNEDNESKRMKGKLWAYVNPRTMLPYDDDYWFHQGEPFLIKSLTIAEEGKKLKANRITVKSNEWPGMYMMIGETLIKNRDTGKEEKMQIKIPFCKVKSNNSLTLEAAGDPVIFNLDLEVAQPRTGNLMEITTYEVSTKMLQDGNGCFYAVDGSTELLSE